MTEAARPAAAAPSPAPSIPASTTIGAVALTVSDPARSRAFYEEVLGLHATVGDGVVALGAGDDEPLVVLHDGPSARPRDPRASGLFHLALLLPDRPELGRALRRVARSRWPLSGAADHLVSEALYLSDPDGNGIELYRDRPRDEWPRDADGGLRMATLPLDLSDVAAAADGAVDGGSDAAAPGGSRIGHVHLQVAEIPSAEAFYAGVLGFDVTVRSYPGALFVSAGGYHHHIGLNTWNSAGRPAAAPGAVGLRHFEIVVPDGDALARVRSRVAGAGPTAEPPESLEASLDADADDGALLVRDPSGVAALVRAR